MSLWILAMRRKNRNMKSKYKKVGVLPIWIVKSNRLFVSDEGTMLEMLDFTIRIGSTPTFLYFDIDDIPDSKIIFTN